MNAKKVQKRQMDKWAVVNVI